MAESFFSCIFLVFRPKPETLRHENKLLLLLLGCFDSRFPLYCASAVVMRGHADTDVISTAICQQALAGMRKNKGVSQGRDNQRQELAHHVLAVESGTQTGKQTNRQTDKTDKQAKRGISPGGEMTKNHPADQEPLCGRTVPTQQVDQEPHILQQMVKTHVFNDLSR